MSATLQMIAVMKTLGVITLKDHSLALVSQGMKVMDTIVQVKFFGFFQIHLKELALVWEVTDVMFWNRNWLFNMRPKAEWAIDSEAMRARGIIVLVKSNWLVKNIDTKQL